MPIYEFKCEGCNFLFERIVSAGTKHHICPLCDKKAKRGGIERIGAIISKGNSIGGTGHFNEDDADRIIGHQAERMWERVEERRRKKEEIRHKTGKKGLVRNSDGEYTPVSEEVVKQRNIVGWEYSTALEEHKKKTGQIKE